MKFGIKRKHSLANRYAIEEWVSLKEKRLIGFVLDDNNELYFNSEQISLLYCLTEDVSQIRDEVIQRLIDELNLTLGLKEVKIIKRLKSEKLIKGGYKINDMFSGIYINKLDPIICELFFDKVEAESTTENEVNNLPLNLTFKLGEIVLSSDETLIKNTLYEMKRSFKVFSGTTTLFDFVLGVGEVMLVKEDQFMNIEDNIGDNLSPNTEELTIDLDVILGTIQIPISQLKELLVGDFVNIETLSFSNVEIRYKNKKLAIGELLYNENEKLAIEIKEVFL